MPSARSTAEAHAVLESDDPRLYNVSTSAAGPQGSLPLDDEMLRHWPSGDLFGLSQNAGMGWDPRALAGPQFLLLSTQGGLRAEDGTPVALGYHTGHWEVGLLVREAARVLKDAGGVPFAAYCSDPCDGRTQGTVGMFDSLPYRNDAAIVFRRLIRSLPTRRGVLGVATCDKGLPAMMLALAGSRHLPSVLVPGGVSLPPTVGEDAGKIQSLGARYVHGDITLDDAAAASCHACASPGGGCQFLGTAATSQVVGEALGMALPHSALAPSGQPIWLDMARRSARALWDLHARKIPLADILTDAALRNAMVVHAAFGGSTNLLLHIPAIAHQAGLRRPTVDDWEQINRQVPRFVDALPNGPVGHPTVRVFLAGGVPEVMLHLRTLGLLDMDVLTASGCTLGDVLDWWQGSERRRALREQLRERDGVDPDDVIMPPRQAAERGLTATVCFPRGNLAPEGSVIKSTAIDPRVVDADGVYRKTGPARVFTRERDVIAAIKGQGERPVRAGDVIVLVARGPMGSGMEETYQVTSALKFLEWGREVAVITDARFSGVSTGACIGHVGPEALAGGPIGKLRDGDLVRIIVDRTRLEGRLDLVGDAGGEFGAEQGTRVLAERQPREDLHPDDKLPDDTRLWAALQRASGGTWGGCVYDVERIEQLLAAGQRAWMQSPKRRKAARRPPPLLPVAGIAAVARVVRLFATGARGSAGVALVKRAEHFRAAGGAFPIGPIGPGFLLLVVLFDDGPGTLLVFAADQHVGGRDRQPGERLVLFGHEGLDAVVQQQVHHEVGFGDVGPLIDGDQFLGIAQVFAPAMVGCGLAPLASGVAALDYTPSRAAPTGTVKVAVDRVSTLGRVPILASCGGLCKRELTGLSVVAVESYHRIIRTGAALAFLGEHGCPGAPILAVSAQWVRRNGCDTL